MLDARVNKLICFSLTNLSFADLICRALDLGYDSKVGTGEEFLSSPYTRYCNLIAAAPNIQTCEILAQALFGHTIFLTGTWNTVKNGTQYF